MTCKRNTGILKEGSNMTKRIAMVLLVVMIISLIPLPIDANTNPPVVTTKLYSFGDNEYGQLGHGDRINKAWPTRIAEFSNAKKIVAGGSNTFVLTEDGDVYYYSYDPLEGLGNDGTYVSVIPRKLEDVSNIKDISVGHFHALLLTEDGDVYSYGRNDYGQLGHGDKYRRERPTKIQSLSKVKAVSAGGLHSLIITENGDLYYFGQEAWGSIMETHVPFKLSLKNVISIAAGDDYSLVLTAEGNVHSFGINRYGEMGTRNHYLEPIFTDGKAIAANAYHSLIIASNGDVYSFGSNDSGQLGHGDTKYRSTPEKIKSIKNATEVIAGRFHSLVITENGDVYSFGYNKYGQLGLGDQNNRLQPTKVTALKNARFISAGNTHTVAVISEDFGGDNYQLRMEVEPASATLIVGDTIKLKAKSNITAASIAYSSTDSSVAAVANDGAITAKKPGVAVIVIKATHQGQERIETTYITVKNERVISVGDFIEFGSYYNEPILWKVINIDDKGDLLLFSEYLLSYKAFDAAESGDENATIPMNANTNWRLINGSNNWKSSNIREWLNSNESKVKYTTQPPIKAAVAYGRNPYSTEAGFLSNFSTFEQKAIKEVTHKTLLSEKDIKDKDGGEYANLWIDMNELASPDNTHAYQLATDKVFFLSVSEIKHYIIDRGWNANTVASAAAKKKHYYEGTVLRTYWTRDAHGFTGDSVFVIDGNLATNAAINGYIAVRPAIYLNHASIAIKSGAGSEANPFRLEAPTSKNPSLIVKPDSWAAAEVKLAINNGLVPYNMQAAYKNNITRQDFCNLIINMVEAVEGKAIDTIIADRKQNLYQNPFDDTSDKAIIAANKLAIVSGRGNGKFDPNGSITRQEAAVMLTNAAKALGLSTASLPSSFVDNADFANWASEAINFVSSNGVMGGVGDNKFSPKGNYTRQQAYITILRLFQSIGSY